MYSPRLEMATRSALALELADETWLNIIQYLDDDDCRRQDLCSLQLTNSRFRGIAAECLVLSGNVPLRGLPGYIEQLVKVPKVANQVTRLRLVYKFTKNKTYGGCLDRSNMAPMSKDTLDACENAICRVVPPWNRSLVKKDLAEHPAYVSVCMCALLALVPNVTDLSLGYDALRYSFFGALFQKRICNPMSYPTWNQRMATRLEDRLRVVVLVGDDWEVNGPRHTDTSFGRFAALTTLSLPMEAFLYSDCPCCSADMDIVESVPPSLSNLRLFCGREIFPKDFLSVLSRNVASPAFRVLQTIDLYFRCTYSSLMARQGLRASVRRSIDLFEASTVSIRTYFLHEAGYTDSVDPSYYRQGDVKLALEPIDAKEEGEE